VAVGVTDPAANWMDQAGVSIEGAKPHSGHLGAILYGPGSRNEGKSRTGTSLIDNIRHVDPEWGIVEFHPAAIYLPEKLPSHAEAYATMQALINGGARFLSPMWGSYAGDRVVHPNNFKSYDAMEGTPFEYQLVWWLRAMQAWPAGSLYYPFGDALVKSSDGWTALAGTQVKSDYGSLHLSGDDAQLGLLSPQWHDRFLDMPAQLAVSGTWPPQSALTAELELDNGRTLSCALLPAGKEIVRCRFPAVAGAQLSHLRLHWKLPAAQRQAGAMVDSVALEITGQH
jgi:hypothetical protein